MVRKTFNRTFKIAAVKLVIDDNMIVKKVSKILDIHSNTIYRWISEYEEYGENAFLGNGSALYNAQYEIKKLKQENEVLKNELEILKKLRAFLKKKPTKRNFENEVLSSEIKQIFEEHKNRYGSLRIAKTLERKGIKANLRFF